jgi:hypothetical protein
MQDMLFQVIEEEARGRLLNKKDSLINIGLHLKIQDLVIMKNPQISVFMQTLSFTKLFLQSSEIF